MYLSSGATAIEAILAQVERRERGGERKERRQSSRVLGKVPPRSALAPLMERRWGGSILLPFAAVCRLLFEGRGFLIFPNLMRIGSIFADAILAQVVLRSPYEEEISFCIR
jgi:hypothetical protein